MAKKNEVAKVTEQAMTLPANVDLSKYAGKGMENVDRESMAVPFLAIMQKGSPQVDKDADSFVKGAEVGDFMLTTTSEIFKERVKLVFCGYRRVFLRWAPVESGGGFKGEVAVDEISRMKAAGDTVEREGKLFCANDDVLRDARIHYVLVVRADGTFTPAVVSMSSTQIKKSKMLNTQISNFICKDSRGKAFTPPSFGHLFEAETVAESNDKGNWRGWKLTRLGFVEDEELFRAAVELNKAVANEALRVDYAEGQSHEATADGDGKF